MNLQELYAELLFYNNPIQAEVKSIFSHQSSELMSKPPKAVSTAFVNSGYTNHNYIIKYTVECPVLDNGYFNNDSNNDQFVAFHLLNTKDQTILCYKELVTNNQFKGFPKYLWDYPNLAFNSETHLPTDLQNYLILK